MHLIPQKLHHVVRYFLLLGIVVFAGYEQQWNRSVFLFLSGPSLYLASGLKKLMLPLAIHFSKSVHYFGLLLPITFLYFAFVGFLLKELWNERGFIRTLSLFCFIAFLIYIHIAAWQGLMGYFSA